MARIYLLNESGTPQSTEADIEAEAAKGIELVLRDDDIQSFYYTDDSFLHILEKPFIGLPLGAKLSLKDILPGVPITYREHATLIVVAMKNTGFKILDQIQSGGSDLHNLHQSPGGVH